MDFLLNELSLNGQYANFADFRDPLIDSIRTIKVLNDSGQNLLKKYGFYASKFSPVDDLNSVLKSNDDAIVRLKSIFSQNLQNGFWELDQKHENDSEYHCDLTVLKNGYSIAEAFERDRVIISYPRSSYNSSVIKVRKNDEDLIELLNLKSFKDTLDFLLEKGIISYDCYSKNYFKNTKLNFDKIEVDYGYDYLEANQRPIFLNAFKDFVNMDWTQIHSSDGLEYKKYSPSRAIDNVFSNPKYSGKAIYKFRVTQLMRCFGYRNADTFYVLRFENDHSVSDRG